MVRTGPYKHQDKFQDLGI